MTKESYIQTIHPAKRDGIMISSCLYEEIKALILDTLLIEGPLTFSELLNKGCTYFSERLGENAGWYFFHVKLDLEARGLICKRKKLSGAGGRLRKLKSEPLIMLTERKTILRKHLELNRLSA